MPQRLKILTPVVPVHWSGLGTLSYDVFSKFKSSRRSFADFFACVNLVLPVNISGRVSEVALIASATDNMLLDE